MRILINKCSTIRFIIFIFKNLLALCLLKNLNFSNFMLDLTIFLLIFNKKNIIHITHTHSQTQAGISQGICLFKLFYPLN